MSTDVTTVAQQQNTVIAIRMHFTVARVGGRQM